MIHALFERNKAPTFGGAMLPEGFQPSAARTLSFANGIR